MQQCVEKYFLSMTSFERNIKTGITILEGNSRFSSAHSNPHPARLV